MIERLEVRVGNERRRERCVWFWSAKRNTDAKENGSECLSCSNQIAKSCLRYTGKPNITSICTCCEKESSFEFVGEQRENGEDSERLFDHYECRDCRHTQAFNVTDYFRKKYEKSGENWNGI